MLKIYFCLLKFLTANSILCDFPQDQERYPQSRDGPWIGPFFIGPLWISYKDKCAILYDGINQSGTEENIPVGEFEHGKNTNANGRIHMVLGDRTESVYVYPVTAQDFLFFPFQTG